MGTGPARGLRKEEGMDRINTQEREMERYWLWLCSCPGLYRSEIAGLIGYFRNPKQLYEAQPRELIRWKKLADAATTAWVNALINYKDTTSVVEAEERLALRKLHFVSRQSPLFPEKLKNLPDCPWGLFYRGRLPDPGKSAVAVIGARRCSNYGKQMAAVLGKGFDFAGVMAFAGAIMSDSGKPSYDREPCPQMLIHGTADKTVNYKKLHMFNWGIFGPDVLAKIFKKNGYTACIYRFKDHNHDMASNFIATWPEQKRFLEQNVIKGVKRSVDAMVDDPAVPSYKNAATLKSLY